MSKKQRKVINRADKFQHDINNRPAYKIVPKNPLQADFIKALKTKPLVAGLGCAGTGKTYVAGMIAAQMLLKGEIDQIVLTRPNVATGKTLGHFPGDISEKLAPWLAPILNVLKYGLGSGDYEYRLGKTILTQPLETIRGQSFDNSFVIVDESQNLGIEELKALTTRIGDNCVMALIGDETQSDVRNGSDLTRFVEMCNRADIDVPIIRFGIDQIVRSDICADLVKMFYHENI